MTSRFLGIGASIAALAGLASFTVARSAGPAAVAPCLVGWAIMAASGLAGGLFLVRAHGRSGTGFLGALVASMLARLALSSAGAAWAAASSVETVWAYLGGLVAGYVPLQAFELVWFIRRDRRG